MDGNDLVREQFGANADAYVESKVHAQGASLERLRLLLSPQPDWHVLDIATGAGHTAFAFAPYVAQVTATDITPQMLRRAQDLGTERKIGNVTYELADAGTLPYDDKHFDLVTCRIAAHHFSEPARFVAEAQRVLKEGGLLAIVDNVVPAGSVGDYVNALERLRDPSHGRCLSLEAWNDLLAGAGLTVKHQETLAKRLDFTFWAQRHDATMRAYLRALLSECASGPAALLDPRFEEGEVSFRLIEGLFVAEK